MNPASVTALFIVPSAKRAGGGDIWIDTLLAAIGDHGMQASVAFEKDGELARRARLYGCDVTVLDADSRNPGGGLEELVAPLADLFTSQKPQVSVFWSPRGRGGGWTPMALSSAWSGGSSRGRARTSRCGCWPNPPQ